MNSVKKDWLSQIEEIISSGKIINGPHKQGFEEEFAKFLGVKHVLGVACGTDAIELSLRALGVGPGDEVITHANAFIAAIEPVVALGARPVLVDISAVDYGPDPEAIKKAITPRTKAIIVVHLLGLPVDFDAINTVARQANIPVLEDASHAQGAVYKGRRTGALGEINAISLGPVKNLSTVGDAGCVATDSDELFEKLRYLPVHGQVKKYKHALYGKNSRLDEVHASYLRLGLKTLDERNQRRREIYAKYKSDLVDLPLSFIPEFPDRTAVFHQAVIHTDQRDQLREYLKEQGVETGMYYPDALHEQEAWSNAGFPGGGNFPRVEKYVKTNLSLPIFAELTDQEVEHVISSVRSFFGK